MSFLRQRHRRGRVAQPHQQLPRLRDLLRRQPVFRVLRDHQRAVGEHHVVEPDLLAGFEVGERGLVDPQFLTLLHARHGLDHDRAFGGRQLQRLAGVRVEQCAVTFEPAPPGLPQVPAARPSSRSLDGVRARVDGEPCPIGRVFSNFFR